jgi:hypothetical protein
VLVHGDPVVKACPFSKPNAGHADTEDDEVSIQLPRSASPCSRRRDRPFGQMKYDAVLLVQLRMKR